MRFKPWRGARVFLKIKTLLTLAEIARLVALSRELRFIDGRASNPANTTKNNLQADSSHPKYTESVQIVAAALTRSREFVDFPMPKLVASRMWCREGPGMKSGAHADAAILHIGNERLRSDLSCTVYVGEPSAYEGGELLIVAGETTLPLKEAGGAAIRLPHNALP